MRSNSPTLLCALALSLGALPQPVAQAAETVTFPASDDLYTYVFYPYMFFEGDRVKGSRTLPLERITSVSGRILSQTQALYCPATVELYVEGVLIASFDHEPVEGDVTFEFGPVDVSIPLDAGSADMTLRRLTPEMEGCGSIILEEDISTLTFDGVYVQGAEDSDGDGFISVAFGGEDCDDGDASIYPGADEACNGVDDNCDGDIDEGLTERLYADGDGDGYGAATGLEDVCPGTPGYVAKPGDCDDTDPSINPDAEERCNDIDDNCNQVVDEGAQDVYYQDIDGDGYGTLADTQSGCGEVPDGYALEPGDCDDRDDGTYPGASEFCDGADNDCDLIIDNRDSDEDGYVAAACGGRDCDDGDASINPEAEDIPGDGVDNDCDDIIDEGGTSGCSPNRSAGPLDAGLTLGALCLLALGRRRRHRP